MNIAEYLDQVYANLAEANTNRFPIERIKTWVFEVEEEWSSLKDIQPVFKSKYVDVSNERLYSFPSDCVDNKIDDIYYQFATGFDRIPPTDIKTIEQGALDWHIRTGDPSYWYVDFHQNKYGLFDYPIGKSADNQMIQLHYRGIANKLNRLYSTGTATFTNASATVSGAGTAWALGLQAGDEIAPGVLLSKTTDFPKKFYTIASVDGDTQITLTEVFAETTQAGASYIGAQVSDITITCINKAVKNWVMGMCMFKDGKVGDGSTMMANAKNEAIDAMSNYKRVASFNEPMYPDLTAGRYPVSSHDYDFRGGGY